MKCKFLGDLITESVYLPSGEKVSTKGFQLDEKNKSNFSPTDLICTSLGSSVLTNMARKANHLNVELSGLEAEIEKTMTHNPLKISRIQIIVRLQETNATGKDLHHIKEAGLSCPVALSLDPNVKKDIQFYF